MSRTKTPVRICISSERYEIAANLFNDIYGEDTGLVALSPTDEMMMGVFADPSAPSEDEEFASRFFVKPAGPAVTRAKATGEETDAIEEIEIITAGEMTVISDKDGDTVAISYAESEITGMEGAVSTVTYRRDEPELLTMLRTGAVKTAMTFRPHHRAICTYDTPYMPFQIGIHALTVDNRLDTEGILLLDYLIEIKGGVAERCTMRMTVAPEGENS